MTDQQITDTWNRYAEQATACCAASKAASAALDGVTGNAPQLGATEAEKQAWRRVMETQAAYAVAAYHMGARATDLTRMVEEQTNLVNLAEHVSTTTLPN